MPRYILGATQSINRKTYRRIDDTQSNGVVMYLPLDDAQRLVNVLNAAESALPPPPPPPLNAIVPDVVGVLQSTAQSRLQAVGLLFRLVSASSPTVEAGRVISQAPEAGTIVPANSEVTVTLSTGTGVIVPPIDPPPVPPPVTGVAVLDNFDGPRANPGNPGNDYISAYQGEDPGQTLTIAKGLLTVKGSPSAGIYVQAQPYPYTGVKGWAKGWIEAGTWDPKCNRMRFAFKVDKATSPSSTGYGTIQIGTYTKTADNNPANQGAHWYHLVDPTIPANRWVYLTLTRFVQHQVTEDPNINWPEDPTYFDKLTRFYFDTQGGNFSGATLQLQPITFALVTGEPDALVQSLAATYTGSAYAVSWSVPKNSSQAYTVRYSPTSMKITGFASGAPLGTANATGNAYANTHVTSAPMPQAATGMYLAVQPNGSTAFSEIFVPFT